MYQIATAAVVCHLKTVHVHYIWWKKDVEIICNITGIHQAYVSSISKTLKKLYKTSSGEWRIMGQLMTGQ